MLNLLGLTSVVLFGHLRVENYGNQNVVSGGVGKRSCLEEGGQDWVCYAELWWDRVFEEMPGTLGITLGGWSDG